MQELFYQLQNWGVFDVLVPFVLIFTLLFAVLDKVQVFKEKKFNVVISMMISLIVIVPHVTGTYPDSFDLVNIINSALPQIALILIAVVLFMVMVGMLWKGQTAGETFGIKGAAVPIAATLILLFIFGSAAYPQYRPSWLAWLGDPGLQMLVIIILIFGLIVYFVTGGKSETDTERAMREAAAAAATATAAARGHH